MDQDAKERRRMAPLDTPTDLRQSATRDISAALTTLLADMFALHLKTKNFHWHISGRHFRDYHLLLDEQGDQIFGRHCRTRSQDRRHHAAFDRSHRPAAAHFG
jgi:starvation-inducible DNA-binding protein